MFVVEENDIRISCVYTFLIDLRQLTIHTPFIISGFYSFFLFQGLELAMNEIV